MSASLTNVLPQGTPYQMLREAGQQMAKAWKASLDHGELTKLETFKANPLDFPMVAPGDPNGDARIQKFNGEVIQRKQMARSLMASMCAKVHPEAPSLMKAGVSTSTGYNFYDLRAPVGLIYPVNTPFRNSLPRIGPVNAGVGTVANWKATRNPGTPWAGAVEGQRVSVGTPDENNYLATYKEIGAERSVTYTAEFAGEGYANNLADEHIRGLHSLYLQEEGMMLLGNSGTAAGNLGFALGVCPTPTLAVQATHSVGTAGNLSSLGYDLSYTTALTTSSYVSVACVALTGMGYPTNGQYGYGAAPSIAGGLSPTYTRTNADGTTTTFNGGTSAVSLLSAVLQATSSNLTIKASVVPVTGAVAYAWYVDVEGSNTGSLGGAKLAGVTTACIAYISGTPNGTQTATATGLSTDSSYNPLEFDGLLTYAAKYGIWTDLRGTSLTSQKNGRVTEIETILETLFANYQAGVDEIWGSADAVANLDAAVRYNGTTSSAYQVFLQRDSQNNILGGFVVSGYQSRFAVNAPMGGMAIPIKIHPMLPAGTLFFNIKTNPYPNSRIPFVSGMMVQRDYYAIEWPQTTRAWPLGTYVHEVLAHYTPWISAVLCGVGVFVGS